MLLHFFLGGNMTPEQWSKLGKDIETDPRWYKSKCPAGTTYNFGKQFPSYKEKTPPADLINKYLDDLANEVNSLQPSGPIVMCGHSFGGWVALAVCKRLSNRHILHLSVFDPVDPNCWWQANTKGLAAPTNVDACFCYYRGAKEAPFSTTVIPGKGIQNIKYDGDHGKAVWDGTNIKRVADALVAAAAVPAKIVKSVNVTFADGGTTNVAGKSIKSVIVAFEDGTTQNF